MTTPRVTELPRRLEPSSPDTFLRGCGEEAPLAVVVQLRPRDPLAPRRPAMARRRARVARPVAWHGPDTAA
jgi:hypothetical protein